MGSVTTKGEAARAGRLAGLESMAAMEILRGDTLALSERADLDQGARAVLRDVSRQLGSVCNVTEMRHDLRDATGRLARTAEKVVVPHLRAVAAWPDAAARAAGCGGMDAQDRWEREQDFGGDAA